MKKLLFNVHMVLGLASALVLLLVGLSGTIIAFEPELNRVLHPALTNVPVTGPVMNWDAVKASVEQQAPGWKLNRFYFADAPSHSTYARLREIKTKRTRQIYINQYTGRILGSTEDGPDLLIKIHDLHVNFLTGNLPGRPGSAVVMAGTYCLLVLSITGLLVWFPRRIFFFTATTNNIKRNRDLHMVVGFWSSLAMFAFALTGIGLHYQTGKLLTLLNDHSDTVHVQTHGNTIEGMMQTAREALPGTEIPRILLSEKKGDPVFIYQRFPEDHTPAGRSFTTLDPLTGSVLSVGSARKFPPMQSALVQYTREIHTGTIFGLPTRILAAVFGFALAVLALTGPLVYLNKWQARRKGQRLAYSRAAVRNAQTVAGPKQMPSS